MNSASPAEPGPETSATPAPSGDAGQGDAGHSAAAASESEDNFAVETVSAAAEPAAAAADTAVPAPASAPAPAPATAKPRKPAVRRPSERDHRVSGQPAFILHSYPYKETSLIVDVLTRDYGRIALMAKGAKRPHSKLRGALQTFQPLAVGFSGKSEVRTLTAAEWVGGLLPLEKSALLCGFYLNELMVKLTARDDPHPELFDHYVATLNQLAHGEAPPIVLRQFERALLKATGVAADLTVCTGSGRKVEAGGVYVVDPERGARPATPSDVWPRVAGKTLLDMEREDYSDSVTQTQSKFLMRFLLAHHLGGAQLNTRQILIDLMQL